jgi:pantoate--beta-alanine ligase
MLVLTTVQEVREWISYVKENNCTIGFVPTMGALHQGHIALVEQSVKENNATVCSIFVNPIQFNNKEDLAKYPRTLENDLQLLEKANCSMVFVPSVEEMYPDDTLEHYHFGALEKVMEGAFRPGHFTGVAIVVKRFFNFIQPDRAYFGKKDYQQLVLIRKLVKIEALPIHVVSCPTVREEDGLAMSSRNRHLSPEERTVASKVYPILLNASQLFPHKNVSEIEQFVISEIKKEKRIRLEYFNIVDKKTLQKSDKLDNPHGLIACIAFWVGKVRLIDNIKLSDKIHAS